MLCFLSFGDVTECILKRIAVLSCQFEAEMLKVVIIYSYVYVSVGEVCENDAHWYQEEEALLSGL